MSRRTRQKAARRVARCPICGGEFTFACYEAILRVHHLTQDATGRWRHVATEPRRLDVPIPLLLVCEGCAHPLGQPTQAVLDALKPPRRGK